MSADSLGNRTMQIIEQKDNIDAIASGPGQRMGLFQELRNMRR
jgi:hypothetical protein